MQTTALDFKWRHVRLDRWERDADQAEQYYEAFLRLYNGDKQRIWALTGHVSISFNVPEDLSIGEYKSRFDNALLITWLTLRYRHPSIASWVEWSLARDRLVRVYECPRDMKLNPMRSEWLHTTLRRISGFPNGHVWCNSGPPCPRMPTLYVIQPEERGDSSKPRSIRRDLIIRSPKHSMDSVGTLQLLGQVLERLSNLLDIRNLNIPPLSFKDEWKRLDTPMELALMNKRLLSEPVLQHYANVSAIKEDPGRCTKVLTVPLRPEAWDASVSSGHQRTAIALSDTMTAQLLEACETAEISFIHAYHAAAILVLGYLQDRKDSEQPLRYSSCPILNLRGECLPIHGDWRDSASVCHAPWASCMFIDIIIPSLSAHIKPRHKVSAFKKILDRTKTSYCIMQEDEHLEEMSLVAWANAAKTLSTLTGEEMLPGDNKSVVVTSLDDIDKIFKPRYGALQVCDLWTQDDELQFGYSLYVGVFQQQLHLSVGFNQRWHNFDEANWFLNQCVQVVRAGLELPGFSL